jgi:photosystem II stability/assembly factor-like uncharacterized protein
MKNFIVSLFLLSCVLLGTTTLNAQWVHTGPAGGQVTSFVVVGQQVLVCVRGSGVYRSSDEGLHWNPANAGLSDTNVYGIWKANAILFAATDSEGLFRSIDNGSHWIKTTAGLTGKPIFKDFANIGINIIVATEGLGVVKSSDMGASWAAANLGLEDLDQVVLLTRDTEIYVGTGNDKIFVSSDTAASWLDISKGLPIYHNRNPILALTAKGSRLITVTRFGNLQSTNNGRDWINDSDTLDDPLRWAYPGKPGITVGAVVSINGIILAGTKQGIFRSADGGLTWSPSNSGIYNFGLPLFETVNHLVSIENTLLANVSYPQRLYATSDNGIHWATDTTGPKDYLRTFAVFDSAVFVGTSNSGVLQSTDFGISWSSLIGITNASSIEKLVVVEHELVALIGAHGLFRTRGNVNSWIPIVPPDPNYSVSALSVSGRNMFVLQDTSLFRSVDLGATWVNATPKLAGLTRWTLGSLVTTSRYMLLSSNLGSLLSSDNGTTWSIVRDGALTITEYVASDSVLFVTSTNGILRSSNRGATWITAGLANKTTYALSICTDYIFASTDSGVWRAPLSAFPVGHPSYVSHTVAERTKLTANPNPFAHVARINLSIKSSGMIEVTIVNVLGQHITQLFSGELSAGEHSFTWNALGVPPGSYVCVVRKNGVEEHLPILLLR